MAVVIMFILAGMLAEAAVLLGYRARTGRGPAPGSLLPNLAAGALLLLALLAALEGAGWPVIALSLLGALVAHVIDLRARWGN